jgi:hypothetical protein
MNKILIILSLIGMVACHTEHPTNFKVDKLRGDFNDITVKNDTFYYQSQPVAKYTNIELECLEKNCVIEISVSQFNEGVNDTTQIIMKYLHHRHPHSKIEIKVK